MKIGYARVSKDEQNLDLQLDALNDAKCDKIFTDEGVSAIALEKPSFNAALNELKHGNTFVLWKLDRAFRSTVEAILTLQDMQKRGIEFISITQFINTDTPEGRKWFRDLASSSEYERELISARTIAGLKATVRRGQILGRPRKLSREQVSHAKEHVEAGKSLNHVAKLYGVGKTTIWRALQ